MMKDMKTYAHCGGIVLHLAKERKTIAAITADRKLGFCLAQSTTYNARSCALRKTSHTFI